jgi:ribose/xylose/arabinose/galactoside ABC-type transport system permease subunit
MNKSIDQKTFSFNSIAKDLFQVKEFTILIIVLILGIVMSISSEFFLTKNNFLIIMNGLALDMIIATAMTIALIGGHVDFSVGSILGVTGFLAGLLMQAGAPIWLAILAALVFGVVLGFINGFLIVKLKVIPIVVTMGTWMAYKGIGLMMIGNQSISNIPMPFKNIAQRWTVAGIPFIIVVMIVVMLIGIFLLKYGTFFHEAFLIGGNIESARLAGIKVNRFIIGIYMIIGAMCAIAGLLMVSRLGSAPSTMGQGMEFRIVTALLIGGVSFSGGEGSILGTFLGVVLMGMISSALAMFAISGNAQLIIIGSILVIAVALDESNRRRKLKK